MSEAEQIGLSATEFDFSKHTLDKAYGYAKCFEKKTQLSKQPLVKYFWDMFPCNVLFPLEALILDLLLLPCCFCCYPCIQVLIVFPWNLTWLLIIFFTALIVAFVSAPFVLIILSIFVSITASVFAITTFLNIFL